MRKLYSEEYKKQAVDFYIKNKHLGIEKCAKEFKISKSALSTWYKLRINSSDDTFTINSDTAKIELHQQIKCLKAELKKSKEDIITLTKAIYILKDHQQYN